MIIKEFLETRDDGVNLFKTYSDADLMIKKVGTDEVYSEAVDVEGAPFEYEETDIPAPKYEPKQKEDVAEA